MADVSAPATARKSRGVPKTKKLSTRVDLTPMVDLGFLLITFFIYSTEMSKPSVMPLHLPADSTPTLEPESGAITLLLGQNNNIFYYEGAGPATGKSVDQRSIRTILLDKKRRTT
jgi:biopolymer transport protein ExbD